MAALSKSTDVDWRLAPFDLAGSRAHARVLHRAGLLTDDELDADGRRAHRALRRGRRRHLRADRVRRGRARGARARPAPRSSAPSAASSAPAAAATTRSPPTCGSTCATTCARWSASWPSLEYALVGLAERYRDVAAPGMTHLQHAQPVLIAHQLLAHAHAIARDVDRLRDWDRRAAVSPLRLRRAGRLVAAAGPGRRRRRARLRPRRRQLHRRASATATSPRSSASSRR